MKFLKLILTNTFLIVSILLSYSQTYMIYKDNHMYVCMWEEDGKEIMRDNSASNVIQFAIDKSHENGTNEVLLGKGSFSLEMPVRMKENTWLRGKNRGTELIILDPDKNGIEIIKADNAKISDLTIISADNFNSLSGIYGDRSKYCLIQDIHIYGFTRSGILFSDSFLGFKINRCTFIDNEQAHIYLEKNGTNEPGHSQISNCTFYCGGYGIKARRGTKISKGLKITDNIFAQIRGMAIDSDYDSTIITGNKLYWIGLDGMRIGGEGFLISGNINSWIRGHGLVLDSAKNGIVSGNNFTDLGVRSRNGIQKCGVAIYRSSDNSILGNSIWNFGDQGYLEYAIYEQSDCSNNVIKGNAGWFHANPKAFRLKGQNTLAEYNTENKGEYRYDDYWDYTMKYGYAAEKFLVGLYGKEKNSSILINDYTQQLIGPGIPFLKTNKVLIESRDMFEQLISIKDNAPRKFGWNGSDLQVWEIKSSGNSGNYYTINNVETKQLLECRGMAENSRLTLGKENKTVTDAQLWEFIDGGSGYFIIRNKLCGKVIESQGLSNYSWNENNVFYLGQPITVSEYQGRKTQMWRFSEPFPAYVYNK